MRSGLVPCSVMHHRFHPRRHHFVYTLFLVALDLDDVPALSRRRGLLGVNKRGLFSVWEHDYLPLSELPYPSPDAQVRVPRGLTLKERVAHFAAAHGTDLTGGRVVLLTMPRVLGYGFNPVSFYFCWDAQGRPAGAIAEVTNTFREVKPFFVPPRPNPNTDGTDGGTGATFHLRAPKHFYVSPFSDVDVAFDFMLRIDTESLHAQIDDFTGSDRTLTSVLQGRWQALRSRTLAWFLLKYPFLTLAVMARIHWHALRLYVKGVPWFRKSARPADQRGLLRPHSLPPSA
jgi:uncharacterized protein